MLMAASAGAQERPGDAVRAIVNAEKQFYEFARDHGTRAAFLEFLADNAVLFDPGPVKGKELWNKRPPNNSSLVWQAEFAAVARGADIGYDTGPYEYKRDKDNPKADSFGHFVSIWRKQNDGNWKVALDLGVEHPQLLEPPPPAQMLYSDDGLNEPVEINASRKAAAEAQHAFLAQANNDAAAAIAAAGDDSVRVYRDGVFPAVGRSAAQLLLSAHGGSLQMYNDGGAISRTGDLGYDYGRYLLKRGDTKERGHYLQVWRTDPTGAWKLALDLEKKLPPEKKP